MVRPEGVFRSDGVYLDDITAKGGMLRAWLDLTATATSTWTVADRGHPQQLVITVMDGTTFKDAFMVDLTTYAWTQLDEHEDARHLGRPERDRGRDLLRPPRHRTGRADGDDLHRGRRRHLQGGRGRHHRRLVVETPFYDMGRPGIKTVKGLHVGYNLVDFASDNPTIAVSYIATPEATSYVSLGSLTENTEYDRRRLQLGGRFWGLGLKFTRSGAGDFRGYDLSAEANPQEESKRKS